MEYNKMIEMVRPTMPDALNDEEVISGVHRTLQQRHRQRTLLAGIACFIIVLAPLAFDLQPSAFNTHTSPTLVESVSATLPSSKMPAPIEGYRNSLRNNLINTMI